MGMGPAHVQPYGALTVHARIAAMHDFPTFDSSRERLAHSVSAPSAQVAKALRLGALPVRFDRRLLTRMDNSHEVAISAQIQSVNASSASLTGDPVCD